MQQRFRRLTLSFGSAVFEAVRLPVESLLVVFWSKKRHFKMSFSQVGSKNPKTRFFKKKKKSAAGRSITISLKFIFYDFFKFVFPSILGRRRRKSEKLADIFSSTHLSMKFRADSDSEIDSPPRPNPGFFFCLIFCPFLASMADSAQSCKKKK